MKAPRPLLTIACVLALGAVAAWANSVSTPNIPVVGPVSNGDLLLGTRSGVTYNMSWPATGVALLAGTNNFTGTFEINGVAQTFPASGNLAGTTDIQTLTNKTLTSPAIGGGTINNALIGSTTAAGATFTTLAATGNTALSGSTTISGALNDTATAAFSNAVITGGSVNGTPIGATTSASAVVTTISAASAAISGTTTLGATVITGLPTIKGGTSGSAIVTSQSAVPTVTSCGNGPPAVIGTDTDGLIATGTGSPTACTLVFEAVKTTAPTCVGNVTSGTATAIANTTTAQAVWALSATATGIHYICLQ